MRIRLSRMLALLARPLLLSFCICAGSVRAGEPEAKPSAHTETAEFALSCKDKPINEVATAVAKHFGVKILCRQPFIEQDECIKRVTVNVKGRYLWPVLAEVSRQSGVGLKKFGRTVLLLEKEPSLLAWQPFESGAVVVMPPQAETTGDGKPANGKSFRICLLREEQNIGSAELSGITFVLPDGSRVEPVISAEQGIAWSEWSGPLPKDVAGKTVKLEFSISATAYVNAHSYTLEGRKDAGESGEGCAVKITKWEERKDAIKAEYTVKGGTGRMAVTEIKLRRAGGTPVNARSSGEEGMEGGAALTCDAEFALPDGQGKLELMITISTVTVMPEGAGARVTI